MKKSNVIDIDLSAIRKKRFRIDGDDNRILELNTSDLNIIPRLKEVYPKLEALAKDAMKDWPTESDVTPDTDKLSEDFETMASILKKIDSEMRELIDYIFDSNVSEVCAPSGSMYDPIGGSFRFEHIVATLGNLYSQDINAEVDKIATRVHKHTDKYIK